MSLSVAMIVKDEEKELPKCLESIKPIADELSIVDTGSTDRTIEIIKEFGNKVDFPVKLNYHDWEDGYFSGNRNYGLQFCTKRWILWIDADETIYPECYEEIRQLVEQSSANAMFVALLSDLPDGRVSRHYLPKFFRNGLGYFRGIVHNQLVHRQPVIPTGIRIHHTGYALDKKTMAKKRKRTGGLLKKQLTENEKNSFAYMNLSRTLMNDQQYEEALAMAEKGLEYECNPACKEMLYYSALACSVQLRKWNRVEKYFWEDFEINEKNLDMTFSYANSWLVRKEYRKAVFYLQRYLYLRDMEEKKPVNSVDFLIIDFYGARHKAFYLLGVCYYQMDKKEQALEMYRRATQYRIEKDYIRDMAIIAEQIGDIQLIQSCVEKLVEMGHIDNFVINKLRESYRLTSGIAGGKT